MYMYMVHVAKCDVAYSVSTFIICILSSPCIIICMCTAKERQYSVREPRVLTGNRQNYQVVTGATVNTLRGTYIYAMYNSYTCTCTCNSILLVLLTFFRDGAQAFSLWSETSSRRILHH